MRKRRALAANATAYNQVQQKTLWKHDTFPGSLSQSMFAVKSFEELPLCAPHHILLKSTENVIWSKKDLKISDDFISVAFIKVRSSAAYATAGKTRITEEPSLHILKIQLGTFTSKTNNSTNPQAFVRDG